MTRSRMSTQSLDPRRQFLTQFEPEIRPFFQQFCEVVASKSTDVIMYTARKAVCLFDAARELGMVDTTSIVTSDRVLDMKTDWLKDKTVTIVDDVLITGSSLYRARQALLEAECRAV